MCFTLSYSIKRDTAPKVARTLARCYGPRVSLPVQEPGESTPLDCGRIWERQPTEPEAVYQYYQAYQAQAYPSGYSGPCGPRNLRDLELTAKLPTGTLDPVAAAYQWHERAGAWDREVSRRMGAKTNDPSKAMLASQLRMAAKARNLGEAVLDKYIANEARSPGAPILTAKEALAILDWGAKLERSLSDKALPTDMPGGSTAKATPLSDMDMSDLLQLQKILAKSAKSDE